MGYSVHRLEIIKAKLVASDPKDLKSLFKFLEELFSDPELEYSGSLDLRKIKKIKANFAEISTHDLEAILDFVLEQIPMSRTSDRAKRILDDPDDLSTLDKIKHYSRELKYSKIEKFIFTLTSLQ